MHRDFNEIWQAASAHRHPTFPGVETFWVPPVGGDPLGNFLDN